MAKPVLTCWLEDRLEVVEGLKAGGQSITYPFANRCVHCLKKGSFS